MDGNEVGSNSAPERHREGAMVRFILKAISLVALVVAILVLRGFNLDGTRQVSPPKSGSTVGTAASVADDGEAAPDGAAETQR